MEVLALLVAVAVVLAVLLTIALAGYSKSLAKSQRIHCVNNLKNIGLSFRIFPTDSEGYFPWQADTNRGGTLRFVSDPLSLWRHFLAVSNELAPRLVICPTDNERQPARTWAEFNDNRFVSYSLGFTATEELPNSVLATDRNVLLDGSPLANAIVSFPSNANVTFDQRIHVNAGNVLLGDGSVQQLSSDRLREAFRDAHIALGTNQTLAFP
jgi:hypothetical protein